MNHPDPFTAAEQAIRSGNIQKACELLQANLSDARNFVKTRITLAELYLRQRRYDQARKLLSEVISRTPEQVHAHTLLAYAARNQGDTSIAAKHLEQASNIKSASQNELKFISGEFMALGAYRAAVQVIKKIDPMDAQCFYHLGLAYFKLGEIGKALPIYRKLFSSISDSATIARELSLVAAAFREYKTAVEAFSRYIDLIQPTATDFLKFADLQLMNRNISESEKHLAKAFDIGENSAQARLLQARLSRLKGDYSKSLSEAKNVVKELPESGTAWKIVSELIEPTEIDANLISQLKRAISSPAMGDQDKEEAQFALSELYTKLEKYELAYKEMCAANQIKLRALHEQGIRYDRQKTESLFNKIRQAYADSALLQSSTDPHSPVFIVGMPRSGTTVINRIVEMSGRLQCIGESEAIPYIHSQLQLRFGGGSEEFAKNLTAKDWNQLAADYLHQADDRGLEIADKMPSNFLYVGMILSMFPHARIVQLRKNPFDVCMSIFAKPFPEGHNYACDVNDLAHYYFQANRLMDFWSQKFRDQVFDINFDQFLESPNRIGKQLFSFLGYEWSAEYLAPPKKASHAFTFSELQVRKPIDKSEAEKWKPFFKVAFDLSAAINSEALESPDRQ
ncbi:tetratricopeptide repeat-containing sulfotransferase family protein [Microbulbifer marinus]|uniref:Tfp pilus assembly protein PilF n=1 Tax=Microbulbifer marinus TaxID=658218 RepID=A0A1H4AGB7_9GAMM|nr:tetratricopeptide repeat-containing sulfotransferase family protein [Microbulbifer marinus]SEA34926.1 Tfp pilus assembly protein PilF [Microbulbifer marinus]